MSETQKPLEVEPYELPSSATPLSQHDILDYVTYLRSLIDETVDNLDLEIKETGFPWYPNMTKRSHQLMNLRHLQGHVGQLSELLMAQGIDIDWIAKANTM